MERIEGCHPRVGTCGVWVDGELVADCATVEFEPSADDVHVALSASSVGIAAAFREMGEMMQAIGSTLACSLYEALSGFSNDTAPGLTWSELMAEIDRELEAGA